MAQERAMDGRISEYTELSARDLNTVTDLYAMQGPQFENKQGRLHNWDEQLMPLPRRAFKTNEAYVAALKKDEAINTLIEAGFGSGFGGERLYIDRIDELSEYATNIGDSAVATSLEGLREVVQQRVRTELQTRADRLKGALAAAGIEFWLIAQRQDAARDHAVAARFVDAAVIGEGRDMSVGPVILNKTGRRKGLFPADYRLIPRPLHTM